MKRRTLATCCAAHTLHDGLSDVSYVLVFDRDGRIIHDGSGDIPTFGQPMRDPFAWEAVNAEQLHTQWSDRVVDVAHPIRIGDEKLGGVRVGLSLAGPAQLENNAQQALTERAELASGRSMSLLALLKWLGLVGVVWLVLWPGRAGGRGAGWT